MSSADCITSSGWHLIFQIDADMEEVTLALPGPKSADE